MTSAPTPHTPESYLGRMVAGRYLIKSVLGAGGMGAVFVAEQQPLGREVALKIIKRALADDPDVVQRFEIEARTVSQISHANIITIFDFGHDDDGTLFLAMELIQGDSLRDLLIADGHMEWSRTLPIVSDVCRALGEAHRAGIIHRDLKPDNVMLVDKSGEREFAKVLDFGVAKLLEKEGTRLTSTGVLVGTPGYISPEQMNGVINDPRSDLYALGVMWYEMLSGLSPFQDTTPMRLALKHMTERPPPLLERVPGFGIPEEVARLVMRLLEKEPEARCSSTASLLAEVDALWAKSNSLPPSAATETGMVSAPLSPPPNHPTPAGTRSAPKLAPPAPEVTPSALTAPRSPTPATAPSFQAPVTQAPTPHATPPFATPPALRPQVTAPIQSSSGCSGLFLIFVVIAAVVVASVGFFFVVVVSSQETAQEDFEEVDPVPPVVPPVKSVRVEPQKVQPKKAPLKRSTPKSKSLTLKNDPLMRAVGRMKDKRARRLATLAVERASAGDLGGTRKAVERFANYAERNRAGATALAGLLAAANTQLSSPPPNDPAEFNIYRNRLSVIAALQLEDALEDLGFE